MPVAELSKEIFEALPEILKSEYELDGEVYKHAPTKKLKASLDALDGKHRTAAQKLAELERIGEENRTKAENDALERLKKEGKIDEITADIERRHGETVKQFEERLKKRDERYINTERNNVINEICSKLSVFDDSKSSFSKLVKDRINIDPETGSLSFLNDDGSASSLDTAGFVSELSKDKSFDRMRQASANIGGDAKGSNGGRTPATKTITRAEFDAMPQFSRASFFSSGGKIQD